MVVMPTIMRSQYDLELEVEGEALKERKRVTGPSRGFGRRTKYLTETAGRYLYMNPQPLYP